MIIIYSPEGGEPEEYDARTLKVSEVSIVQRTIDMKWDAIKTGLAEEDLDAMRGVVWVLKKRQNPSLRFGEFDPGVDEMVTRMDKKETQTWVEEAFAMADRDPEVTREQVAEALRDLPDAAHDPEHAKALVAEMLDGPKADPAPAEEAPEDPATNPNPTSTPPGTNTSGSSPTSSTSPLHPSMT